MSETKKDSYVLGNTDEEHRRLILQAHFLGELSETFFVRAGLETGMHILDIGCGAGDVSFLAAAFAGPQGSVLGIDQSEDSVVLARQRAADAGLSNVRFEVGNLEDLKLEQTFDALIGRLVMIYMKDPATVLKRLASRLRPGGLIVLQELDMTTAGSYPEVSLYNQCGEWIGEAFTRAGIDHRLGTRLHSVFTNAGLSHPQSLGATRVESGRDSAIFEWTAQTLRALLPVLEQTGVVTESEIGFDTLADRMREEAVSTHATLYAPMLIGAWTRT